MEDILKLVIHIITTPNIKYPADRFLIGNHITDYRITNTKPKEHKLWTPKKGPHYQCFLFIQYYTDTRILKVHQVLDDAEAYLTDRGYDWLVFGPAKTIATERGGSDPQFKVAIDINLAKITSLDDLAVDERTIQKIELKIKNLIIDIADETIRRGLHYRRSHRRAI
jgi:hypothetical protein